MTLRRPLALLALLAAAWWMIAPALAADYLQRMNTPFPIPDRYVLVNDYFGVFHISKQIEIAKKLEILEKRNGTQIVFLSVPKVGKEGVDAYARAVFEKWDLGNNGQGNGVLFLMGPDGAYIATGPGIAGAIPDVKVARIFREIAMPAWQREEYAEGAEATIDALIKAAQGEDTEQTNYDYLHPRVPTKPEHIMIAVLVLFGIAYGAALFWRRRQSRKARD